MTVPPSGRAASPQQRLSRRALIIVAVATAVVLLVLLIGYAVNVLLLVFAAILVAVFLRALSDWVSAHTALSSGWALTVVVLALLGTAGLLTWLLAPQLAAQFEQLARELPPAVQQFRERVERYAWVRRLLNQAPAPQEVAGQQEVLAQATSFFSTTLGAIVNIVIVLVVGLYLAAQPQLYVDGLIRLLPHGRRARAREVMNALGYTLRWWLIGRFSVMTINGVLTALALWLLGIPLPLILGLITAILNFIPNLGPILAGIPAVLLALTQGPTQALYVVLLYIAIQNIEGFVLTPLVQRRTVSLPPALLITAQVLLGVLVGSLGVIFATPLAAVALVLVKMLYIRDTLGDPVEVPGSQ